MREVHQNNEHFWKAYDLCVKNMFTVSQANISAKRFSQKGLIDASEGAMFYVLNIMVCNKGDI